MTKANAVLGALTTYRRPDHHLRETVGRLDIHPGPWIRSASSTTMQTLWCGRSSRRRLSPWAGCCTSPRLKSLGSAGELELGTVAALDSLQSPDWIAFLDDDPLRYGAVAPGRGPLCRTDARAGCAHGWCGFRGELFRCAAREGGPVPDCEAVGSEPRAVHRRRPAPMLSGRSASGRRTHIS